MGRIFLNLVCIVICIAIGMCEYFFIQTVKSQPTVKYSSAIFFALHI